MTQKEIDILLDKFEAGMCNAEEEQLVESILEAQAEGMNDEYKNFISNGKSIAYNEDTNVILKANSGELDELLEAQSSEMGKEYERFMASAKSKKSSTDVELLLKAQDGSLDQLIEEQDMGSLYERFVEQEKLGVSVTDVELVVQSHTGGLDALLNQQQEMMSKEYKMFLEEETKVKSATNVEDVITKKEDAKVIPLGSQWKKYRGIAAMFVAVIAAVFVINYSPNQVDSGAYANGLTAEEQVEAELALKQTLAALGITKNKLDKGTDNMIGLKKLKHTEIFK